MRMYPATSDYAVSVGRQSADVYAMPTRYGQTFENGKPVSVYDGAPLRRPMYFACADIGGMGLRLNEHVADVHFAPVGDADSGCELWDQTTPAVRCREEE